MNAVCSKSSCGKCGLVLAAMFALTTVFATQTRAEPILYTVQFTVGEFDFDDALGLAGAQFVLEYEWDAALLTPDFDGPGGGADRVTVWPSTNLDVRLHISGSSSIDGIYTNPLLFGNVFQLTDNDTNPSVVDSVQFPNVAFVLPGDTLTIGGLIANFPTSFNTPPLPGTVLPYEFCAAAVQSWQQATIEYDSNISSAGSLNLTGDAFFVPSLSGDLNGDCVVDTADLGILIGQFGMSCDAK